jgi:hypothetical protein
MKIKIVDKLTKSFFPKKTLKSRFFNNKKIMDLTVSGAILLVVSEFLETIESNIGPQDIEEILLTGSLANYNYNEWSDIDVHLVVDYSKLNEDKKFIRDYLRSKAINWNDRHKITIFGHEIEIYFQDVKEPHFSTGVYDISDNRWLVEPRIFDNEDAIKDNLPLALKKADYLSLEIDELAAEDDKEDTIEKIERLKEKIKKMRQSGLARGGEYSVENLAFKILRRRGDLTLLYQTGRLIYDKNLSIPRVIDEDQEWWKKRRKIDRKNYKELVGGATSKKSNFKRKYASKKTGYPKSVSRKKIAKSGAPFTKKPPKILPTGATSGPG